MIIQIDLNFEDSYIPIQREIKRTSAPCVLCESTGYVSIQKSSREIKCPDCKGTGTLNFSGFPKWIVKEKLRSKIGAIHVCKYSPSVSVITGQQETIDQETIHYVLDIPELACSLFTPKDLFTDVAAAQQECDKRNQSITEQGGATWTQKI